MSAKQESPLAQLIRLAAKADSLSLPSLVQKIAFEQNWQDISGLFSELALVDSLLMDSLSQLQPQTLSNLEAERDTLLTQSMYFQAKTGQ